MEVIVAAAYGVVFSLSIFALVKTARAGRTSPLAGAIVFALLAAAPPWLFPLAGNTGSELSWTVVQSLILGTIAFVLGLLSLSRARRLGGRT